MAQKKSRPFVSNKSGWKQTGGIKSLEFKMFFIFSPSYRISLETSGLTQSQGFLLKSVEPQLRLLDLIDSHQFSITNSVEESQPDGNI